MHNNVANQAIAHLTRQAGGQPLCRKRNPHIVVTIQNKDGWRICQRCAAKLEKIECKAVGR